MNSQLTAKEIESIIQERKEAHEYFNKLDELLKNQINVDEYNDMLDVYMEKINQPNQYGIKRDGKIVPNVINMFY